MKIGFAGLSHLGIIYSLATATKGFDVIAYQNDEKLVSKLNEGEFPIQEPGLRELFKEHKNKIRYTSNPSDLANLEIIFAALDVKTDDENNANFGPLIELLRGFVPLLNENTKIILMSQVQPGFTQKLGALLGIAQERIYYQVETLVFGQAVQRALSPERYMIGCPKGFIGVYPSLYKQWLDAFNCPLLPMRYESAELAKISINLFLIASVSTTNMLANICESVGANWHEIAPALRLDRRIGPYAYLTPGLGLSGGNLERDLVAVQNMAAEHGTLAAVAAAEVEQSNNQRFWVARKLLNYLQGRLDPRIGVLGLAYKIDTASTKNSPSIHLLNVAHNVSKLCFDPVVKNIDPMPARTEIVNTAEEVFEAVDAVVVMTPWKNFTQLDVLALAKKMKGKLILDPMGLWADRRLKEEGWHYKRMGVSE